MIEEEDLKVKLIDKKILEELKDNLEIKADNADIIKKEHLDLVLDSIEQKKQAIFSLFNGDFSVNEYNLDGYLNKEETKIPMNDRIANNIILNRVELTFKKIMNIEPEDKRLISVSMDRYLFIKEILKQNVNVAFIKKIIENDEIIK